MLQIKRQRHQPKLPRFLQRNGAYLVFLIGMALLGFLAQFQWIGYIVIVLYLITAYSNRLSSRLTFLLALLTLGVVPVSIIVSNWLIAQNFAAYSFVLFAAGIVQLTVELQREPRTK